MVEVYTNNPGKLYEWGIVQEPVTPEYQLEEVYRKVKLKWGTDWNEEQLEYARFWDERNRLKMDERRKRRDGSRFILIAQPKKWSIQSDTGEEGAGPLGPLKWFLKASRWREKMSEIWQQDSPGWDQEWEERGNEVPERVTVTKQWMTKRVTPPPSPEQLEKRKAEPWPPS
jgi:hypothetical protein